MIRFLAVLLICFFCAACEPFTLERREFPVCAKPSAGIGYSAFGLQVEFFLDNPQGDLGVVGWSMGDGRNRTGTRFTYIYDRPGTYTVTILARNACDDTFTVSRTLTVQP